MAWRKEGTGHSFGKAALRARMAKLYPGEVEHGSMERYDKVRCLFCITGREEQVVRAINKWPDTQAIFPKRIKRYRHMKEWEEVESALLPGYVFVYSDRILSAEEYVLMHRTDGVIRMLRHENNAPDGELIGVDRRFADWIWNNDGVIGVLDAVRIGEWVEIVDGVLKTLNARVVQMDRRKQMAKLELDIVGSAKHVWLSFDYFKERKEQTE
jgi:transcription antitermination factor NusG